MFLILDNSYIASFADDNTPYTINQNTDYVTKSLEELSIPILSWFKENKLKLNLDNCHLIASGSENAKIKLDDVTITKSKKEKLLGIIFDDKLRCETEMYKLAKGISPTIMQQIFRFQNSSRYNLGSQNTFEIPFRNHVYNGTESISYLGPKVWELVPNNLKRINSLTRFKEQIKKWNPENCPCRLCKTYIQHVGFIN